MMRNRQKILSRSTAENEVFSTETKALKKINEKCCVFDCFAFHSTVWSSAGEKFTQITLNRKKIKLIRFAYSLRPSNVVAQLPLLHLFSYYCRRRRRCHRCCCFSEWHRFYIKS